MDIDKEKDFVDWLRWKIDTLAIQINSLQLDKESFEEKLRIEVEGRRKIGINI